MKTIALKVLLRQRHLQTHRAFCREYDKVADTLDKTLKGGHPSKAQFYRWLSGELLGLPYADHCRVLESMFPGWKAEQLFQEQDGSIEYVPEPVTLQAAPQGVPTPPRGIPVTAPSGPGMADLVAVFPSRSAFAEQMPPHQLLDGARHIQLAGLSLNMLCQQYPDRKLTDMLEAGTRIECLFLQPGGAHIRQRETEEQHPDGLLSNLTTINIGALQRVRTRLTPEAQPNLQLRAYDEPPRFNLTIIDDATCVVQPYLPDARGVDSPTLVAQHQAGVPGLFDTFTQVFASLWERSTDLTPPTEDTTMPQPAGTPE
jgi:hypothetical protein